jgi:hypothetical protein
MSARIIPFQQWRRAPFAVELMRENEAWLVRVRSHAWVHGDKHSALRDARRLSRNFGIPIKEVTR